MKKTAEFRVQVSIPEGCGQGDVQAYIHEAISCWNGSFDAETNPLTEIDKRDVKVVRANFAKLRERIEFLEARCRSHEQMLEEKGVRVVL